MLRGKKSPAETRFELVTLGAMLIVGAALYVALQSTPNLQPLVLFFPGLILLGSAIYQTITPDWKAGWLTYVIAILLVAIGLAGLINSILGEIVHVQWYIIALVALGVTLIFKALYAPNPNVESPEI